MRNKMWLAQWLEGINELVTSAEYSAVNLISVLLPWIAPVMPAMLTYTNVRWRIEFPSEMPAGWTALMATTAGITVEAIGILAMVTIFSLMAHNQSMSRKAERLSPGAFVVPYIVLGIYLFVIVAINVWMHIDPSSGDAQLFAIIGLTVLTIPAMLIVSVRNYRNELLRAHYKRTESASSRTVRDSSGQDTQMDRIPDWRTFVKTKDDGQLQNLSNLSREELMEKMGWPDTPAVRKKAGRMVDEYIPREMISRGLAPPQG